MEKFLMGAVLTQKEFDVLERVSMEEMADEDFIYKEVKSILGEETARNVVRNITDSLKKYGKIAINKNTFLKEATDVDVSSKLTWWSLWKNNIAYIEKIKGKDLYDFNSREVIDLIKSFTTANYARKDAMWTFINKYMTWACYVRNLIPLNPCDSINKEEVVKVESNSIRASIMSLTEFYDMIYEMESKGVSWFDIAPLLLARYGIVGKEFSYMINLKWEDIDEKNLCVRIKDESGDFTIGIDEKFLEAIDKIFKDDEIIGKGTKRISTQVNNGYVLKNTTMAKNDKNTVEPTMIYRRMQTAFKESGLPKISVNALLKSRRFDEIFNKRRKRKLNAFDIQDVMLMFNPSVSAGSYKSLKEEYEALTGDEVLHGRIKDSRLNDINSEKYVQELREELGY